MEEKKPNVGRIIIIVLLVIFILLAAGIAINMFRMRKAFMEMAEGAFIYKDGVETYMEYGQVVIDKLVEVDGKIYYVDGEGHKVKDTWAIIDNDGHYGYFGNFGDLVVNRIRTINGKDYYFDENGILYQDRTEKKIKVIEGVEYIANKNGELRLATAETFAPETEATTAEETTTASPTTKATTETTKKPVSAAELAIQQSLAAQAAQQAAQQAAIQQSLAAAQVQVSTELPFANAIDISGNTVPNEFGGPGVVGGNSNNTLGVLPTGVVEGKGNTTTTTTTGHATEIKIQKTEKIVETYEGDEYDCKITLLKPIMLGTSDEETINMNACIDEVMDAWMDDVMGVVGEYDTLPKSVTFTSATLTSSTKSRAVITITGTVKPKSGSNKTIRYRITYDRTEANADITKTSSS